MSISFACSSPPSPSLSHTLPLTLSPSLALPISGIDPKVFAPARQEEAEPSEAEPSRAETDGRTAV